VFFVPAVVVSAALLAWQLVARHGESLLRLPGVSPDTRLRSAMAESQTKGVQS
jgi:hypothetical protein